MNEFQRCLVELDIDAVIRLWPTIFPDSPRPGTRDALMVLHYARTQANSIALRQRAYSHRWLCERDLPSGLPDFLKPSAERIYPRIVEAVGVAVKALSGRRHSFAKALERTMSDAVAEAYADGKTDPEFVKARMDEARQRFERYA